jgi:hypothetical protein
MALLDNNQLDRIRSKFRERKATNIVEYPEETGKKKEQKLFIYMTFQSQHEAIAFYNEFS